MKTPILSDGTEGKVGAIVVILNGKISNGNPTGTVTKILKHRSDYPNNVACNCHWVNSRLSWQYFVERYDNLRAATPEEIEIYKKEELKWK